MKPLSRAERNDLLARLAEIDSRLYPDDDADEPSEKVVARLEEKYYSTLAEYGDRLPRRILGKCPFTGMPFERAIDPFGLDGPWWHKDYLLRIEEPEIPAAYRIHLGSYSLMGRTPREAGEEVQPGPDVPFVVPRLLRLSGMVAVIMQLDLEVGDRAWVISYWSQQSIPAVRLHQPWLRKEHWFKNAKGKSSWTIANDTWDFDLAPYLADGRLRWIDPADRDHKVLGPADGRACPFVGLLGDRLPQIISDGERELDDLPDGRVVDPFSD